MKSDGKNDQLASSAFKDALSDGYRLGAVDPRCGMRRCCPLGLIASDAFVNIGKSRGWETSSLNQQRVNFDHCLLNTKAPSTTQAYISQSSSVLKTCANHLLHLPGCDSPHRHLERAPLSLPSDHGRAISSIKCRWSQAHCAPKYRQNASQTQIRPWHRKADLHR